MFNVVQLAFFLSCLLLRSDLADGAATVTIQSVANYEVQRQCVQNALYWAVNDVGCNNWYNDCFCRADMTPSVRSYLSSRIPKSCSSNDVDLSSGVEVYTSYCNEAMGQVVVATTNDVYSDTIYATSTNMYTTTKNNYATSYATATPAGSVGSGSGSGGSGYSGPTYTNVAHPGDRPVYLSLTSCLVVATTGILALSIVL